ncbi:Os03g0402600 [Oryza sativa Japonica Group]|nr:Os03g0402600 [Oryza sativa Japonica Group]
MEAEMDLDFKRLVDEREEHDEDALRQLIPDIRGDELPAPVMATQLMEFVGGGGGVRCTTRRWMAAACGDSWRCGPPPPLQRPWPQGCGTPPSSACPTPSAPPPSPPPPHRAPSSPPLNFSPPASQRLKLLPLPLQLAMNPRRSW